MGEGATPPAPPSVVQAASPRSELALLQPVNVVGELQRGPQLQPHVLHHHVAAQQQQGLAIDLLQVGGGTSGWSGCPGSQEKATQGSASHGVLRACCDTRAALLSAPSVPNHPSPQHLLNPPH